MKINVLCKECGTLMDEIDPDSLQYLEETTLIYSKSCPLCKGAALTEERERAYEQARQEILEGMGSEE